MSNVALLQNEMEGPTTFHVTGPPLIEIEWQGKGDQDGRDIQEVPESLLADVHLRRAIRKGVFTVVEASDEALAELTAREMAATAKANAKKKAATADTIKRDADNDMLSLACIGPGARGGQCGNPVVVRAKKKDDKPPLCEAHKQLATQYVLSETSEMVDGKAVKKWSRAGMTEREHEQVGS